MTSLAMLAAIRAMASGLGVIVVDGDSNIQAGVKHEHLLPPLDVAVVEREPRKRPHPTEEQKRLKRLGKRMRK